MNNNNSVLNNGNNRGGNNNTPATNNNSIYDNSIGLEPIATVYNLSTSQVEEYTFKFLTEKLGVTGVKDVCVYIKKITNDDNKTRLVVEPYLVLDPRQCDGINQNRANINPILASKLETGMYTISEDLTKKLQLLTSKVTPKRISGNLVSIKLDIFIILAAMLSVKQRAYRIQIDELKESGNGSGNMIIYKMKNFVSDKGDRGYRRALLNQGNKFSR